MLGDSQARIKRGPGNLSRLANIEIIFRPLIRYSVIKMRAKKANLAGKRGPLKESEEEGGGV